MKSLGLSFLVLSSLLFGSCTSTVYLSRLGDYKERYVGQTERNIILDWGAPSRETSDGNTGKILVYEQLAFNTSSSGGTMATSSPLTGPLISSNASTSTSAATSYVQFFINEQDRCYDVITNHVKEGKEFSIGRTIALCAPLTGAFILLCIAGSL